jgi:DNA-binding CsgD family transcriptional regulator
MNIDEYIKANSDNLTIEVLCEKFDVSIPTVYRHLRMNGAKVKKDKNLQRTEEMKKLRDEGKTYQEIADMYGVSRQRAEQIIHDHN